MPSTPLAEKGAERADGFVCLGRTRRVTKSGEPIVQWMSPAALETRWFRGDVANSKARAKKLGLPHDLDEAYLRGIYPADGLCPITGIQLVRGGKGGGVKDHSATLDRGVPELGYVRGNVSYISNRANVCKGRMTVDQLERLLAHMKRKN